MTIDFAILATLTGGPRSGYDLKKLFTESEVKCSISPHHEVGAASFLIWIRSVDGSALRFVPANFGDRTGSALGSDPVWESFACSQGMHVGSPVPDSLHTPCSALAEALGVAPNRHPVSTPFLLSVRKNRYSVLGQR